MHKIYLALTDRIELELTALKSLKSSPPPCEVGLLSSM